MCLLLFNNVKTVAHMFACLAFCAAKKLRAIVTQDHDVGRLVKTF